MLNRKSKLTFEILIIISVCLLSAVIVFLLLSFVTGGLIESYVFDNDINLSEAEFYRIDSIILIGSVCMGLVAFITLFMILFSKKIRYIKMLIEGINNIQKNNYYNLVEIEGNNELTELAKSINYLAISTKTIKEKEMLLNKEKENLIHSLSHDIRTPLTSIISYTELNALKAKTIEEKEYYEMILRKSNQIKELTEVLLDGNKRNLEDIDDLNLLFIQIIDEFKESLIDFNLDIKVNIDIESGKFDPVELLRIFDNLASNIIKYAHKSKPVILNVSSDDNIIKIVQSNYITDDNNKFESHNLGISIMKRIVQFYGGNLEIEKTNDFFEIKMTFIDFK